MGQTQVNTPTKWGDQLEKLMSSKLYPYLTGCFLLRSTLIAPDVFTKQISSSQHV